MENYQPLYIPKECQPSLPRRILALFSLVGDVFTSPDDFQRLETRLHDSIVEQLSQRRRFPSRHWMLASQNQPFHRDPEQVCRIMTAAFDWPNHHFLPADDPNLFVYFAWETRSEPEWDAIADEFYAAVGGGKTTLATVLSDLPPDVHDNESAASQRQ